MERRATETDTDDRNTATVGIDTMEDLGKGAGTARDREMGRADEPLGDLGGGRKTWQPPAGEQGISNRPKDEAAKPREQSGETESGKASRVDHK